MTDKSSELAGVSVGMLVTSWLMVALRFYVRLKIKPAFGLDDILLTTSLVSFTAASIMIVLGAEDAIGKHADSVPALELQNGLKYFFLSDLLYVISSCLIKASFTCTLLRIAVCRWHIYTLYTTIFVVCAFSIFYFFWLLFACDPVSFFWERATSPFSGQCASPDRIIPATYGHGVMLILADIILAVLPMFMVKGLNMSAKLKIWVVVIFSVGSLASVATIVRITYIHYIAVFNDILYYTAGLIKWSMVEVGISIIASSAITMRPLAMHIHLLSQDESTDTPFNQEDGGHVTHFPRIAVDAERGTYGTASNPRSRERSTDNTRRSHNGVELTLSTEELIS